MMKGCVIDFETTGLDSSKDEIIEIGFTLVTYDTHEGLQIIPPPRGCFVKNSMPLSEEITKITGITQETIDKNGIPPKDAINFIPLDVDFFVAHNADFDKGFYNQHRPECGIPWICSMKDIDYNTNVRCRILSHLAFEKGVQVDPHKLHRADYDTLILARLLEKVFFNPEETLRDLSKPRIIVNAVVPPPWKDGGKAKDICKQNGFRWNAEAKKWQKEIKEEDFLKTKEELGYDIAKKD